MLDDTVVLSLFLVSTFGSGSSPNNVKDLEGELRSIVNWRQPPDRTCGRLKNLTVISSLLTSIIINYSISIYVVGMQCLLWDLQPTQRHSVHLVT